MINSSDSFTNLETTNFESTTFFFEIFVKPSDEQISKK